MVHSTISMLLSLGIEHKTASVYCKLNQLRYCQLFMIIIMTMMVVVMTMMKMVTDDDDVIFQGCSKSRRR